MRKAQRHREVFLENNGPGPWPCYGCGELVLPEKLIVHHKDHDHSNNDPHNLASMHPGCHATLHSLGRIHSDEAKAKIGAATSRRRHTPETRAKMSATRRGRPWPKSEAHIEAVRAAQLGKPKHHKRHQCGCCSLVSTGAGLNSHQRTSGHTGRITL